MSKQKKSEKTKRFGLPSIELNLRHETKRDIVIITFSVLGLVSLLSVFGFAGSLGTSFFTLLQVLFGVLAYIVPILLFAIAYSLFKDRKEQDEYSSSFLRVYLGVILFTGSFAGLIHIFILKDDQSAFDLAVQGKGGGFLGAIFSAPLHSWLGPAASVILFALLIVGGIIAFNISFLSLFRRTKKEEKQQAPDSSVRVNGMANAGFVTDKVQETNKKLLEKNQDDDEERGTTEVKVPQPKPVVPSPVKLESIVMEDRKDWKLPPFDLLDDNKTEVDSGNIETNVAIIQKTLSDFGIEVEMGEVNVGPTVTQYTLRPTTGVKLSQIAGLQNDLALALAAHSLRMELPIPGKPLVGIEVPNRATQIVRLREVMQTNIFVDHKSRLALALGRDVAGIPQVVDLAKMPHLLIAGATGTGKSVAINSLFISLLYRNTPQDVKFIVVDPKRVEMTLYNGIPHLLTPVVTDHDKAVNALKWAVTEMDRRYRLLADAGKRNITEYNEVNELKLPFIVIIVDELADLMAVAQADVEATIVRLAQMARAVGIHLVLATQRPSVEVITGLIKANITSRIAFAVASQIDSRTILDSSGAEKLLGNGDMLFTSAEFNKPKRVQGAFIGEKEVKKVVDFFKQQTGAVIYNEEILERPKNGLGIPGFAESGDVDDDLYEAAVEEVRNAGKASASLLQRRLRVGYARAARLLDILEDKGVIGPGDGAKPREVYGGGVPSSEKAEYGIEENQE